MRFHAESVGDYSVCDVDGALGELFVLLLCFGSPRQRPLSAADPARPQPVPTVYWDCHRARGGSNKGGVCSYCPAQDAQTPLWAQTEPRAGGCQRSRRGDLTSSILQRG